MFNSVKMGGTSNDRDGPNQIPFVSIEEPDRASVHLEKEEDVLKPDARLSCTTPMSAGVHEFECPSQMGSQEKSVETVHLDDSFPLFQKGDSGFHQNQPSHDASRGNYVLAHDYLSTSEEANGASGQWSLFCIHKLQTKMMLILKMLDLCLILKSRIINHHQGRAHCISQGRIGRGTWLTRGC